MASIFMLLSLKELLILGGTLFLILYLYVRHCYGFWKRQGFYHVQGSFPFGNFREWMLMRQFIGDLYADLYKKHAGQKYVGFYSFLQPVLLVRDLDVIKQVCIKDSYNFLNHGMYYNTQDDPLSGHLFALDGEEWKTIRAKMTPVYTSGKMKFMYSTMVMCVTQLRQYALHVTKENDTIDFKKLIARHGINVIANTAMGLEGQSLWDDSELAKYAMKVADPTDTVQTFRFILPTISKGIAKFFRLRFTPPEVQDYFMDVIRKVIDYRKESGVVRNDFIHLLMELQKQQTSSGEEPIKFEEIVAQVFVFVLAGFESSSATMSFCLYELAMNPEIQRKLMEEIDATGIDVSYEKLNELPYLNMVLQETWRKYPPCAFIFRESLNEYTFNDGLKIPGGVKVVIPSLAIHNDPEYFPEPEKFIPERFSKTSPYQDIIPYSYSPFGEGPRYCIAKRFGLMQNRLTLFSLIYQFRVELSEKTVIPPKLDKKLFVTNPEGGMWLRLINRRSD